MTTIFGGIVLTSKSNKNNFFGSFSLLSLYKKKAKIYRIKQRNTFDPKISSTSPELRQNERIENTLE